MLWLLWLLLLCLTLNGYVMNGIICWCCDASDRSLTYIHAIRRRRHLRRVKFDWARLGAPDLKTRLVDMAVRIVRVITCLLDRRRLGQSCGCV